VSDDLRPYETARHSDGGEVKVWWDGKIEVVQRSTGVAGFIAAADELIRLRSKNEALTTILNACTEGTDWTYAQVPDEIEALKKMKDATYSHVDGRDLLHELQPMSLHPRTIKALEAGPEPIGLCADCSPRGDCTRGECVESAQDFARRIALIEQEEEMTDRKRAAQQQVDARIDAAIKGAAK